MRHDIIIYYQDIFLEFISRTHFSIVMFALQDLVLCATVRRFSTICHVQYS